jgi:hypothetical protein
METANLTFRMTHPAPSDLDAATAFARAIADQVSAAAPANTWRAEENADPVTVDHLKELVIPNETSVERAVMGYGWGIVSGQPPRDLYLQMSIGVRGTASSGKAQLGFDDREQFGRLEEVYGRMARDSSVDRLQLSAGVSFLLDQSPDFNAEGRRLPTLGWRNRLRKPPTGLGLSLDADAAGTIYAAWPDCQFRPLGPSGQRCGSHNDIVFSTSRDGRHWTDAFRIPIDPATSSVDHFLPAIAVDPQTSGTSAHIGIVYYFYPEQICGWRTCQPSVGFISSTDGGTRSPRRTASRR